MATYTETKLISASVEDVFAYRLDFTNLPEYNPDVTELARTTEDKGVGAQYRFRIKVLALHPWAQLQVTEVVKPKRIAVEIDSLFEASEVCEFEGADEGTLVTFTTTIQTSLGPLSGLIDRLFTIPQGRRQTRRELDLIAGNLSG